MLFVGSLALLCGAAGLVLMNRPAQQDSGLAQAQALWLARPFTDYQLAVVEKTQRSICLQDVEVQDEQVHQVSLNRCTHPTTWTVNRLFDWIAQLEQSTSNCFPGPGICACRTTKTTQITYDAQFGYPQSIVYEWQMQPNWTHPDYWRHVWWDKRVPSCSRNGFGGTQTVTVSLTPLP
jgi:hypothetical protein